MSQKKELVKNTIIITIGKFSTQIVSFLLLPIYTIYLTTAEYGRFELINTITAFLVPVITLLMEESMFRFLIDCDTEKEKSKIISNSLIYIIICTFIAVIGLIVIGIIFNYDNYILLIIFILSWILNLIKNAFLRGTGKIKDYSASGFISSILNIILNVIFIAVFKWGFVGLFFANVLSNSITSIVYLLKVNCIKYVSIKNYDSILIRKMFKYSFPLVPNSISWAIINLSDRLLIASYIGESANGIYSMSNKFPNFMNSIYGYFYTAWQESSAKALRSDDSKDFYSSIYRSLHKLIFSFVLLIIVGIPFVFNLFIKNDFTASYKYIPILILAMYFNNMSGFYGGIFTAYKDTNIMGKSTLCSAIINLVINFLLIRKFGLWAAAISTLISTLFIYVYRGIKVKKYIKLKSNFNLIQFVILAANIYCYHKCNISFRILVLIVTIIYIIYLNMDIIKPIFRNIYKIRKK